ncbi:porin family protein [Lewinella sp. JB7]|uniref:porin family protein n=1 Tax=Lewinella sp. JB7 TaxID=2962887 RepID=UPI0020CA1990|nr:porin family protein [Lewinella sp. JB7]MCP9236025.1 PorT family protein [Lewinella sp. JB7]
MKTHLLLLLALLVSGIATAQSTFGIRAGFGQSSLRSGETFDAITDRTVGVGVPSFGFFAELPVTDYLSLRPGLEYTKRGTGVGLTDDVELAGVKLPLGAFAKTRFSYLEAPLLVQLNLPTESAIQPYALLGPSVGYATGGKVTTSAKAIVELNLYSTDVDLDAINYQRFNVAVVGGLGARARVGQHNALFLEARYSHDLSQPYDVPVVRDKVGFQGWNVGAGMSFAL